MNLISQIFGIVAVTLWIWSVQQKSKKKVLTFQMIANLFYSLQYFLLGLVSTGCISLVSTIRSGVYGYNAKRDKENPLWLLLIFIAVILAISLLTITSALNLIPVILVIFYTYATWHSNPKLIRWSFLIAAVVWIYYNVKIGAYVAVVGNIFEIISGITALIRFDLEKKKTTV